MDQPESFNDVAALRSVLDPGTGECVPVNGCFSSLKTPKPESASSDEEDALSAASLLSLSKSIEPRLQRLIDWVESPPFPATPDWIEFPLAPPQFEELKKLERLGYFDGRKLRYDYSEAEEILTFRVPGAGHEYVKSKLTKKISQGLADAATRDGNSQSSSEFALLLTSDFGSASLKYPSTKVAGKMVTRHPDAQFLSDIGQLPSLIIEVAWTQTTGGLQKVACDYILGSSARIRTVIGFDVDVSSGKGARVCVWRPVYNGDNIAVACDSTEIRSVSGVKNPNPQAGLRLTLEDFAYPRSLEEYPDLDSVVIFIPVDDLYEILVQAEAAQERFGRRDAAHL